MAGSLNKVCLIGNVGKDPEIRHTQSGTSIGNLTLATEESWIDKSSGERKSLTEWHRISIFNQALVKVVEQYVKKGSKIYVEGKLQTRKWTDQQGVERYTTETVLGPFNSVLILLTPKGEQGSAPRSSAPQRQPERTDPKGNPQYGGDLDDSIPF